MLTPVVDAGESNDIFGTAGRLQVGEVVQGTILPHRDHDWYGILVPTQGQLQTDITGSPVNLEMVYRVWNADKGVILDWQAPLRAGGDVMGIADIAEPGFYYIEVADSRDDARSPEPYTLKAVLIAE